VRTPIPLSQRKYDVAFLVFFVINLTFITYIVDFEQLVVRDPAHFVYPPWPPARLVDLVHWWGRTFDPVLLARPVWWKATIWIDSLFFGPFYIAAIYAFARGRDWIRVPAIFWAGVMMTNVTIIMSEEVFGPHATPRLFTVAMANAPWFLFPIAVVLRVALRDRPFSRESSAA
jgi:hypothetical protein